MYDHTVFFQFVCVLAKTMDSKHKNTDALTKGFSNDVWSKNEKLRAIANMTVPIMGSRGERRHQEY